MSAWLTPPLQTATLKRKNVSVYIKYIYVYLYLLCVCIHISLCVFKYISLASLVFPRALSSPSSWCMAWAASPRLAIGGSRESKLTRADACRQADISLQKRQSGGFVMHGGSLCLIFAKSQSMVVSWGKKQSSGFSVNLSKSWQMFSELDNGYGWTLQREPAGCLRCAVLTRVTCAGQWTCSLWARPQSNPALLEERHDTEQALKHRDRKSDVSRLE